MRADVETVGRNGDLLREWPNIEFSESVEEYVDYIKRWSVGHFQRRREVDVVFLKFWVEP